MAELVSPITSPKPHRSDTWWIVSLYLITVGAMGTIWFFAMYQKFTLGQFGLSLVVMVVIVALLRWLRADRRGFAFAMALTAIGSFIVLYWANSHVTLLADLDIVSKRLCHVRPGGLVSVTVYSDSAKSIAYARSHDTKGITDSYYTEYYDQYGTLICTQAAFSTDPQDKCAVAMKALQPSVNLQAAAQREVCGNFPI